MTLRVRTASVPAVPSRSTTHTLVWFVTVISSCFQQCSATAEMGVKQAALRLCHTTPAGIVLFELFHRLVQQLGGDSGSGGSDVPTSPLAVLPLLGAEIARVGGWPEKCETAAQEGSHCCCTLVATAAVH